MTLAGIVRIRFKEEAEKMETEEIAEDAGRGNFVQITIGMARRQATECGRCLRLGFDE
jgi:hypothetical protein